ncbi:hypothetical protein TNCV_4060811 [Trichonephila clavipes]|nr:hypothetical protein TNCV_4060811 [Trichonephila clavipes]
MCQVAAAEGYDRKVVAGVVQHVPDASEDPPCRGAHARYVKSLVYADKPQTLDHLEDNIRRVIADIRPQMLEKVIEYWTSRLDYIRASRGSPMQEIIFKISLRRAKNLPPLASAETLTPSLISSYGSIDSVV